MPRILGRDEARREVGMKLSEVKSGRVLKLRCFGFSYIVKVEKVELEKRLIWAKWFKAIFPELGFQYKVQDGGCFENPTHIRPNKP